MSAVEQSFDFGSEPVRVYGTPDAPEFVAADVARILGYAQAKDMTRSLADEEKGRRLVPTRSGATEMGIITEAGLYQCIMQRQTGRMSPEQADWVRRFQRWVTREVLPTIRRTGGYAVQSAQPELPQDYLSALKHLVASEEARQNAELRAAEGKAFREAIESNDGLAPREFHKAYFANVGERVFFELLYSRGLLIDQRGKGTERDDGSVRDGSQHGHPSFAGKKFFYLDSGVSKKTGYRFEQTRVRPGQPELDLIEYLTKAGLCPTRTESKELVA